MTLMHTHASHASHASQASHADGLPVRAKADLADPAGSLDPSDHIWSQWRSAALIAEGPAKIARFVLDAAAPGPRDVLEVGCGSGYLALELARAGHRVIAVDPSDESLGLATRTLDAVRAGGECPALSFAEADFLGWDDGGKRFDALVFNLSLHHIDDLRAVLDKSVRLLRPGGRVVVNDYVYDRLDDRTTAWLADLEAVVALAAGDSLVAADPAEVRADLAERIAESARSRVLHGFDPLIAALRETFAETHFSWQPFLFTRIANRAPGVEADRSSRLVAFLADLERLRIAEGTIQAVCYRFVGTVKDAAPRS